MSPVRSLTRTLRSIAPEYKSRLVTKYQAVLHTGTWPYETADEKEALQKLNRKASDWACHVEGQLMGFLSPFCHGFATVGGVLLRFGQAGRYRKLRKWFKIKEAANVGA